MDLEKRVATALVEAYATACTISDGVKNPHALSHYGQLLQQLQQALSRDDRNRDTWKRWLRPFDVTDYIRRARADQEGPERKRTHSAPLFSIPEIVRAHAETLTAQATFADEIEELVDAILDLYFADREADLHIAAFSWHALAQTMSLQGKLSGEPLFVRLGRVISRSPRAANLLRRVTRERPEAHILSYVLIALSNPTDHFA